MRLFAQFIYKSRFYILLKTHFLLTLTFCSLCFHPKVSMLLNIVNVAGTTECWPVKKPKNSSWSEFKVTGCTSGGVMYLVFSCMPDESNRRWLKSSSLCLCDVFWALINSLCFDYSRLDLRRNITCKQAICLRPNKKLTESIALWLEMLPAAVCVHWILTTCICKERASA